jgi:hypothetical protein
MLIYNKINNSYAYFIHIPRTGGRFVNSIFIDDSNYFTFYKNYANLYRNKEIPHLTYPHYLDLDKFFLNYDNIIKCNIKNINHFTTVRNPFDRFKSQIKAFLMCEKDLSDIANLNKKELIGLIDNTIKNIKNNWFVPQSSFISPQTKIWKFENGYNLEFVNWIEKHLNFKIENLNVEYTKKKYDYAEFKFDFNILEKIKPFIEEIYDEDYDKFGYQKGT